MTRVAHPEHSRKSSITAIQHRLDFSLYHLDTAEAALCNYIGSVPDNKRAHLLFPGTPEELERHAMFHTIAGANITAAVHCLHALADLLSQVVYFSLGGRLTQPFRERDISVVNVYQWLTGANPKGGKSQKSIPLCSDPRAPAIAAELAADIFSRSEFTRLDAIANISKHRSMVRIGPSVGVAKGESSPFHTAAIAFEGFVYDNIEYVGDNALVFLKREMNQLWLLIDKIQLACDVTTTIKP